MPRQQVQPDSQQPLQQQEQQLHYAEMALLMMVKNAMMEIMFPTTGALTLPAR